MKLTKNKHIIDPDKLSKTFGIKYKKTNILVNIENQPKKNAFQFLLNEKGRKTSMDLTFSNDLPGTILLRFETKNEYWSELHISNIKKVTYLPEFKKIELEMKAGGYTSKIEILSRGQFSFFGFYENIKSRC